MPCTCFIVPRDVLTRLPHDKKLSPEIRKGLASTAEVSHEIRELRAQAGKLTSVAMAHASALTVLAPAPAVTVYDCKQSQTLPGTPVPKPGSSSDATAKRSLTKPATWPPSTSRSSTGIHRRPRHDDDVVHPLWIEVQQCHVERVADDSTATVTAACSSTSPTATTSSAMS